MISTINSISLQGVEGFLVKIEADVQNGIPTFNMVGLPDTTIRESKDRVRVAIKNSGYEFPLCRILVNFAPAYLRKEGPHFDLPIAIGILHNIGSVKEFDTFNTAFLGELSLSGEVTYTKGSLAMVLEARKNGIKNIFIPYKNIKEVSCVDNINIYPVKTLKEVILFLNKEALIEPLKPTILSNSRNFNVDFSDVKGQSFAKRAIEICASGKHNILMLGPPGGGKTMLSKRIPTILPSLTLEEAIEVTKIHSISDKSLSQSEFITNPPFREPHHTASFSSIIGGGANICPGEISLAHNGVLYLDELPEFKRDSLEALREPLEAGEITISRAKGTYKYPSRFLLVSSMNPCKCGFFGYANAQSICRCNDYEVKSYQNKLSGPLIDRLDIHVSIEPVQFKDINSTKKEESSESIRKRVEIVQNIQKQRFLNENIKFNSQMQTSHIKKYCKLSKESTKLIESAFNRFSLSTRSFSKIIKIARTIADMDLSENINENHISEALQYRILDRKII